MKTCNTCGETKPFDDFYKHTGMADGHLGRCKECHKQAAREHRRTNIEKVRQYERERSKRPERIANAIAQALKWRNEDRRRMKCHNAVARALRAGTLDPKPCEQCASEKAYAHHESYDRPLDVTFLCQPCHKKRHAEMRREGITP